MEKFINMLLNVLSGLILARAAYDSVRISLDFYLISMLIHLFKSYQECYFVPIAKFNCQVFVKYHIYYYLC